MKTERALLNVHSDRSSKDVLPIRSVLAKINEQEVSSLARSESRNRETHFPPLGTFRWWARRTGAVNDAILAAAVDVLGQEKLTVFDPFAGGGTIPLVALRAGHRVHSQDLNPWAVAGVRQMLSLPSRELLKRAHSDLGDLASLLLKSAYETKASEGLPTSILHTYRVAVGVCGACGLEHRQFPYSLLTLRYRKERMRPEAVLACPAGHVFSGRADQVNVCPVCERKTDPDKLYTPQRTVTCPRCEFRERLSERAKRKGWRWEVVLVERVNENGRQFDTPSKQEIRQADLNWKPTMSLGKIPEGSETNVLLRHGYQSWSDLYPNRQRVVTERLLDLSLKVSDDPKVLQALRMAIVGSTEFAGHLSRWDRFYLKCNDGMAGHRFNFSTFVPELNVWGVGQVGRGTVTRRVGAMMKASDWLDENLGNRPVIETELQRVNDRRKLPDAWVICGDSGVPSGAARRFDLVLTDPPYHDDVQYGELSLPFRAWAGLPTDELQGEASTNRATGTNSDAQDYSASVQRVFAECHRALRREGRLIFSYANREPEAWVALFRALDGAGFSAVACLSVHSENETDFKKRNVQSCTEDLLMELSPGATNSRGLILGGVSDRFMDVVSSWFSRIGNFESDWEKCAMFELAEARKL